MNAIAFKAIITLVGAVVAGAGVALFTIAKQDGSKAGQILGVAIPVVTIMSAIYLAF